MTGFDSLGMIVEPIDLDFASAEPHFLVFLRSLLLARLGKASAEAPDKFDPTLLETIEQGRSYSAADLCAAQVARTDIFAKVQAVFDRFGAIASPTASAPALPVGLDPHADRSRWVPLVRAPRFVRAMPAT